MIHNKSPKQRTARAEYQELIKQQKKRIAELEAENQRLRDTILMYESWMKRNGSLHIHGFRCGSIWDAICNDYPYLDNSDDDL